MWDLLPWKYDYDCSLSYKSAFRYHVNPIGSLKYGKFSILILQICNVTPTSVLTCTTISNRILLTQLKFKQHSLDRKLQAVLWSPPDPRRHSEPCRDHGWMQVASVGFRKLSGDLIYGEFNRPKTRDLLILVFISARDPITNPPQILRPHLYYF